jgi:hypothetical protein
MVVERDCEGGAIASESISPYHGHLTPDKRRSGLMKNFHDLPFFCRNIPGFSQIVLAKNFLRKAIFKKKGKG